MPPMLWGAEEVVGAGRIAGASGDKDGGVGWGGKEREEGGESNSPVVTCGGEHKIGTWWLLYTWFNANASQYPPNELAYSFLVFLTLIFERTYAGLPCDLRLTPDFSSCCVTGLCGRPSIVLDGSSACVCVSDRECLVRHSGAVSARLASASVIRVDGGKMETAWRKGKGLLESLSWMVVLVSKRNHEGKICQFRH